MLKRRASFFSFLFGVISAGRNDDWGLKRSLEKFGTLGKSTAISGGDCADCLPNAEEVATDGSVPPPPAVPARCGASADPGDNQDQTQS
jgi:hypothetical protein